MSRPQKCRRISFLPKVVYFKPAGIPMRILEEVQLSLEETEAIRLKDIEDLEQEQCAEKMNISRGTLQRILNSARKKVADALLNGKAIRIEGGNFELICNRFKCEKGHEWDLTPELINRDDLSRNCPFCKSKNITKFDETFQGQCSKGRGNRWMNQVNNLSVNNFQNEGKTKESSPDIKYKGGLIMKIAVSAIDPGINAEIDPRFGRCEYFVIVDTEMKTETIDNENSMAGGGAGIATAQMLSSKGVTVVLTGNCGPNAFQALSTANIQVITGISGKVKDAVENYKAGRYKPVSEPNVADHFGKGGMGQGRGRR